MTPAIVGSPKHGRLQISTIRPRKAKYAGMDVSDVVRLMQLEAANAQMQRYSNRCRILAPFFMRFVVAAPDSVPKW